MATLRDIRRRIVSVNNTKQITNAMKMVSTAKLARAQNAVRAAQPYAEGLRDMVTQMSKGLTGEDHPLLAEQEGGLTVVLLFTSDRGLCGAFNANLNKTLLRTLNAGGESMAQAELVIFGRTGNDFFKRRGFKIGQSVLYAKEAERRQEIRQVVETLKSRFISGEVEKVFLAYNHFQSAMTQHPRVAQLLPIVPQAEEEGAAQNAAADEREALFEPSQAEVLDALLPTYLENQCLLAHLNTEAGEHGARMVAMDGATRNAGEMVNRLTLAMNKARQAAITKELIEIVNGAQAL